MDDTTQTMTVEDLMNFYSGDSAPDTEAPPMDQWADVPEDYRAEVYCELPPACTHEDGSTDGIGDLDRLAAEKLLKRYHRLSIEEREAVQFVDDEIARACETLEALHARRKELLKPIERKRSWLDQFRPLLESWARTALAGQKARSIKLTYGAVRFRRSPDRLEVVDEDIAVAWAQAMCPAAVRRTVLVSVLKATIKDTGEAIPGCELVPGEDTFSVEVSE
jgi:hypothetical protein